jgi:hypothetical protein
VWKEDGWGRSFEGLSGFFVGLKIGVFFFWKKYV